MKEAHKTLALVVVVLLALGSVGAVLAQGASASPKPTEPHLWAPADLTWTEDPEMHGAKMAVLWGDPAKGAYGALNRWPSGTVVPLHWHTHANDGVVVSGTLVIKLEGSAPKELGPGSVVSIPGGVKHETSCKAGADCLFFAHQDGFADVQPVTPLNK